MSETVVYVMFYFFFFLSFLERCQWKSRLQNVIHVLVSLTHLTATDYKLRVQIAVGFFFLCKFSWYLVADSQDVCNDIVLSLSLSLVRALCMPYIFRSTHS